MLSTDRDLGSTAWLASAPHSMFNTDVVKVQAWPLQVWRWSQQYQAQLTGQALPEMMQLIGWLKDHIPADDNDPTVTRISHGDYRYDPHDDNLFLCHTAGSGAITCVKPRPSCSGQQHECKSMSISLGSAQVVTIMVR